VTHSDLVSRRRWRLAIVPLAFVFGALPVAAPAELGYLGPRGTFSEQAAKTYCKAMPDVGVTVPFETMTAVVEALRARKIGRGILPVVSTVAGFPQESSRLLLAAPDPGFRVVAELIVPVDLNLVVQPGTPRERIREILSHPNALGESRAFLDAHYGGIPRTETASTASASERVRQSDGSLAAVSSAAAARLYGLEILDASIQEDPRNATSFWVIARADDEPIVNPVKRVVLLVDAPCGSPALSAAVASLYRTGLEVEFVESTPLAGGSHGFRYLLALSSAKPVPRDRIDRAIHAASAVGGRALRLGSFD
jgi:prephenate dehydratase